MVQPGNKAGAAVGAAALQTGGPSGGRSSARWRAGASDRNRSPSAPVLTLVRPTSPAIGHSPNASRDLAAGHDDAVAAGLLRCLQELAHARDTRAFQRRLEAVAEHLGFPLVNATLVVERVAEHPLVRSVRNSPPAMLAKPADPSAIRRDPIIKRLKVSSAPFAYDQGLYVREHAADLWEEQAAFGFRTGLSTAVHLPGGRHFLLGIDRAEALPARPARLLRLMAELQLLSAFAQDSAIRLLMPASELDAPLPTLTAREREILQWTMAGKSSSVTGQILRISLSTVNHHLRLAMAKLAASSKHQAAAKASALGLL